MTTTVTIPARFNGPPDSGNGGYTAGLVAAALGGASAEVTLKAPPPLDRPLDVERCGDSVVVRDGETRGRAGGRALDRRRPPAPVPFDVGGRGGRARARSGTPQRHPFPSCFVCGPVRDGGRRAADLRRTGRRGRAVRGGVDAGGVARRRRTARLPDEMVWAALDCPTSAPIMNDPDDADFRPIVLARLAVRIDAPVIAGEPTSYSVGRSSVDGRKREAAAALYTAAARCAPCRARCGSSSRPAVSGYGAAEHDLLVQKSWSISTSLFSVFGAPKARTRRRPGRPRGAPHAGRDPHRVPLREVDDVVAELHPGVAQTTRRPLPARCACGRTEVEVRRELEVRDVRTSPTRGSCGRTGTRVRRVPELRRHVLDVVLEVDDGVVGHAPPRLADRRAAAAALARGAAALHLRAAH